MALKKRKNSRRKGCVGEREAAALLKELFGWQARRSQQFCGQAETADLIVEDTPDIYWEVKRVQRLAVPKTMVKAREDAGRKAPALLHRQNNSEWLLTIYIADLPRLVHAYDQSLQESRPNKAVAEAELSLSDTSGCEGCEND